MGRKQKYSVEEKLNAVREYLDGNESMNSIAKHLNISFQSFKQWVSNYEAMGTDAFATSQNKHYSKIEKEQAVAAYLAGEGSLMDMIISGISYLGISLPAFWFGIMLIIVFSMNLGVLPSSGMRTIGVTSAWDVIQHGILPTVVLSVNNIAVFVRYIRANTIEQMEEEYVITAVSKGVPQFQVMKNHVLKNCLLPIITMVGMNFGTLITGSFIVESVFGWPGLGTLCMNAINSLDYTMIMGITMLSCTVLLLGNFLADILYGLADPRIKQTKESQNG